VLPIHRTVRIAMEAVPIASEGDQISQRAILFDPRPENMPPDPSTYGFPPMEAGAHQISQRAILASRDHRERSVCGGKAMILSAEANYSALRYNTS
jgi:hypothetical protein